MTDRIMTRRTLLATTTLLAAGFGAAPKQVSAQSMADLVQAGLRVYNPNESDYPYEIQRTEEEWRARFADDDDAELAYEVLRNGRTETPKTTDMWLEVHDGDYLCRGCDLPVYEGRFFQRLEKGWVFFHHSNANTLLFGLDGPVPQYGQASMGLNVENALTEVHCRRCGSHLGHHLKVSGIMLHCINGTALTLA